MAEEMAAIVRTAGYQRLLARFERPFAHLSARSSPFDVMLDPITLGVRPAINLGRLQMHAGLIGLISIVRVCSSTSKCQHSEQSLSRVQ
jgi:hypothetical protein